MATLLLAGDLGMFDPAWCGWRIRGNELISPEGWQITVDDILAVPLLRLQLSTYQTENRALRAAVLDVEFPDEQPEPGEIEIPLILTK